MSFVSALHTYTLHNFTSKEIDGYLQRPGEAMIFSLGNDNYAYLDISEAFPSKFIIKNLLNHQPKVYWLFMSKLKENLVANNTLLGTLNKTNPREFQKEISKPSEYRLGFKKNEQDESNLL